MDKDASILNKLKISSCKPKNLLFAIVTIRNMYIYTSMFFNVSMLSFINVIIYSKKILFE